MQYKTHLATSLAISLPIMYATNSLSVVSLASVAIGSLLPDIDEPRSWIGKRTRGISDIINKVFKHRGLTHSLIALGVIFIVVLILSFFFPAIFIPGCYLALGYFLHLLEDSFSKSGIAWFQPFNKKAYKSGFGKIYYVTGGIAEKIIFVISVVVILLELKWFNIL